MLSNEELNAIKERCEKATEGPWEWEEYGDLCGEVDSVIHADRDGYLIVGESDEIFISHARQDIPKLLSEIDELRNRLGDAEELLEDASDLLDDMYPYDTETYADITDYFENHEPITRRDE